MALMFPIDPPPGADDLSYRGKQDVVVAAGGAARGRTGRVCAALRAGLRSEANRHGLTLHGIYRDGVYLARPQHWLVVV